MANFNNKINSNHKTIKWRISQKVFTLFGILALGFGLTIMIVGNIIIIPKVDSFVIAFDRDLKWVDDMILALNSNSSFGNVTSKIEKDTVDFMKLLPTTMISTYGVLQQSKIALNTLGETLDALEHGVTQIVLPKTEMGRNAASLRKLSDQLNLLAGMTQKMQPLLYKISREASKLSLITGQMRNEFPNSSQILAELSKQIRDARKYSRPNLIKLLIVFGIVFLSGIYCLMGLLCLAFSKLFRKMDQVDLLPKTYENRLSKKTRAA